jgi:hypothetical protein
MGGLNMGRRVFIGQDFQDSGSAVGDDAPEAASDEQVLAKLFGEQVSGDDYEIVGSDQDTEIVGADTKLAPKAPGSGLIYQQWLPLTGVAGIVITAGSSYDLELKPQRKFRPGDLTLSDAALGLVITQCAIGQENQFVASGAIPCDCFSKDSTSKKLASQTAGPGVSIMVSFNNPTAASITLRGKWQGDSVVR